MNRIKKSILIISIVLLFYILIEILPFIFDILINGIVPNKIWKYSLLEVLVYFIIFIVILIVLKFHKYWRFKVIVNKIQVKSIFFILLLTFIFKLSVNPFINSVSSNSENYNSITVFFALISILLLQPVNEEIIFRQILYKIINPKDKYILYVGITSLFYTVFHYNVYNTNLTYYLIIFFLGILLAFIYLKYGFWGCILSHFFYNFLWVLQKYFNTDILFINSEDYVMIVLSISLLILLLRILIRSIIPAKRNL